MLEENQTDVKKNNHLNRYMPLARVVAKYRLEEVLDYVAEVYSNDIGLDEVLLHLLPVDNRVETDHRIRAYLQAKLRVSPQVKYISAADIQKIQFPEGSRKPIKFIDKR